jgi:Ni,Fe-hydrogenase III small subunit
MIGVCSTVGGITRNDAAVVGTDGTLAAWNANLAGGSPTGESIIVAE